MARDTPKAMVTAVPPPPSLGRALAAALDRTQRLLTGPGRARRWRTLVLLAAMAGLVGAGAAPPPLGLLQPVWADPALHHTVFDNPGLVGGLIFLALFLLLMGGFGRSFTLGFFRGLSTGEPDSGSYRVYVRAGAAHFIWSAALTIPLYLLLFAGEALVAHDTLAEITRQLSSPTSTDAELTLLLLRAVGSFVMVLVPWTLLTLPLMVTFYELTPAAMVHRGLSPAAACRYVLASARKLPHRFLAYLGVRYLLQFAGNLVALVVLLPCLLVSSPATAALGGGGWLLCRQLGGPGTAPGAAVLTVGVLFAVIAHYCTLCAALLPVSVFVNSLAVEMMENNSEAEAALPRA